MCSFKEDSPPNLAIFSHNLAGNDGGVVFSLVQNTLDLNHGHYSGNRAGNDGGVFFISF